MDEPSGNRLGALRCGLSAAVTFLLLYSFLALLLLNVSRTWVTHASDIQTAVTRLRLLEIPVLLIDVVTGGVATLVGMTVAHRRGLGRQALLIAVGSPVVMAVLLVMAGSRNTSAAVLDLLAIVAGTALGAAVSRRLQGELP